jgi:hypothetical protein
MATAIFTTNDVIKYGLGVAATHELKGFAFGDVARLEYNDDMVNIQAGFNLNTAFAFNMDGFRPTLTLRLLRGSDDDGLFNKVCEMYTNGLLKNESTFNNEYFINMSISKTLKTLASAESKGLGEGWDGKVVDLTEVFDLNAGVIQRKPGTVTNVQGDLEQTVVEYILVFAFAKRRLENWVDPTIATASTTTP